MEANKNGVQKQAYIHQKQKDLQKPFKNVNMG